MIADYFPRIIEPALFHTVQEKMEADRGKGGCGRGQRLDKAKNLFRHLAICAYCGGTMAFLDRGQGRKHLICDNGRRRVKCARHAIRYDECESLLLENCHKLRPDQVLPNPDDQAKLCYSLHQRIAGRQAEVKNLEGQVENLIDQIARTPDQGIRDRYEAKVSQLTERRKALADNLKTDQGELNKAKAALQSFTNWKRSLETLKKSLVNGDVEIRMRLQAHLREIIDRIEVFAVGFPVLYDPDSDTDHNTETLIEGIRGSVEDVNSGFARSKEFRAFLKYVGQRRMSKEGRFLRVWFKTGARVDLVPEGSLAKGWELAKDGKNKNDPWRMVKPDIEKIWREFETKATRNGRMNRKGKLATT